MRPIVRFELCVLGVLIVFSGPLAGFEPFAASKRRARSAIPSLRTRELSDPAIVSAFDATPLLICSTSRKVSSITSISSGASSGLPGTNARPMTVC